MNIQPPLVLFGAFDRHNFGDLLFPHLMTALLPGRDFQFAGLAARDLRAFGGHRVDTLTTQDDKRPARLIHVGGELLTCSAWQAAVMLLDPAEAAGAIARYDNDPAAAAGWAARQLGTKLDWAVVPQEAVSAKQTTGKLSVVEDYLDKAYYEHLLKSINPSSRPEKILLGYIRKEIDANNLLTILKLKREGLSPDKISPYLIEGGDELTKKEMERLIAIEGFDPLLQELQKYSFYEDIKESLERISTTNSLNDVTLAIKRLHSRQAEKFSHLYPLSVLPIIDYLIRKKIEVDNIRVIARCKESGLDTETMFLCVKYTVRQTSRKP